MTFFPLFYVLKSLGKLNCIQKVQTFAELNEMNPALARTGNLGRQLTSLSLRAEAGVGATGLI